MTRLLRLPATGAGHRAPLTSGGHRYIQTQEFNPGWGQDYYEALKISAVLQTTLDVQRLMELFRQATAEVVAVDGLSFSNADQNVDLTLGSLARHTFCCQLKLDSQYLGELVFARRKRFSSGEVKRLENLLRGLVYPLRNALQYRAVLHSAHEDPLTGLGNRGAMDAALRREIDLSRRHNAPLTLLMMDIDDFKSINDRHGHSAGDHALRAAAQWITQCMRRSDMLFRYGGEEFVALLHGTAQAGALKLAERIRLCVEQKRCVHDGAELAMTLSMGLAQWLPEDDAHSFFARADIALYQAKLAGRNRVEVAHRGTAVSEPED